MIFQSFVASEKSKVSRKLYITSKKGCVQFKDIKFFKKQLQPYV